MENTVIKDVILEKKLDGYINNNNDFVATGEITVTITLSEYRKLVAECANAQSRIDEANRNKYERESDNTRLKNENNELRAKLYELEHKDSEKDDLDDLFD